MLNCSKKAHVGRYDFDCLLTRSSHLAQQKHNPRSSSFVLFLLSFFLFFDFFIFFLCLDEKSFYKIEVTKCVKGRSASGVVLVELKPSLDNNKLRISSTFVVFSSTCCFEFTKFCCFPECYVTKR